MILTLKPYLARCKSQIFKQILLDNNMHHYQTILKTDCYNEVIEQTTFLPENHYRNSKIFYVECDRNMAQKCNDKIVIINDIEKLQQKYQGIISLSTIDHTPFIAHTTRLNALINSLSSPGKMIIAYHNHKNLIARAQCKKLENVFFYKHNRIEKQIKEHRCKIRHKGYFFATIPGLQIINLVAKNEQSKERIFLFLEKIISKLLLNFFLGSFVYYVIEKE